MQGGAGLYADLLVRASVSIMLGTTDLWETMLWTRSFLIEVSFLFVPIDSGRGVSRPNSQIDVSDLRVSRTESVGKKSVQSVISDQGVVPDEGKRISCKQAIIEGNVHLYK